VIHGSSGEKNTKAEIIRLLESFVGLRPKRQCSYPTIGIL
jgi:hypothetical protein